MKLRNQTTYRSDDLRRFIVAAHKATGSPLPAHKIVRVTWSRHRTHWGWAYLDNSGMLLTIPKGKLDMTELCQTTEHELAHNRGLRHGEMTAEVRWGKGYTFPEWAKGIELRLAEAAPAIPMQARIDARAAHAAKMVARWEKKLAIAKRQAKKWAKKVRYYETRGPVAAREPRAPKVIDPTEVVIVLKGSVAGEFQAIIMDLSSESNESDRIAMHRWLESVGTRSGYKFKVTADVLGQVGTLIGELENWQHHNEITDRSFPRILAKVKAARKAFEAKEVKTTPTEG